MSTALKLANLKSFTARPIAGLTIVKKGDVILVDDSVAEKLLEGGRINLEGERVPYWVEAHNETPVHDFTTKKVAGTGEAAAAQVAMPSAKPASQRRRATAATA